MKNIFRVIRNNITALRIVGIYGLCVVVISIIFYPLIPMILNYPPNTFDNSFQWELEHANYTQQYILIVSFTLISITIWLLINLKPLSKWKEYIENLSSNAKEIKKIRDLCVRFPNLAYIIQSMTPSIIVVFVITISTKNITAVTLKLWIIFISFGTFMSIFSYIFTKRIFTEILVATYSDNQSFGGNRISLTKRILLQLTPIFIVSILFTSLIGYSRLIDEKGDAIYKEYKYQFAEIFRNKKFTEEELISNLKSIELNSPKDICFLITPGKRYINYKNEPVYVSDFFAKYLWEIALNGNGHVFDYYGVDEQGYIEQVLVNEKVWIVGVRYLVGSSETINFFIFSFLVLFFLNFLVVIYFTKTLTDDIERVTNNLEEISEGVDVEFDKKLALTSNDEIGDLVLAFNKIQVLEKKSIETIKENQAILLEQERLASLGQLIGGIAHNLKTPIMSISGGIEAVKDLVYEYRDSVGDKSVTEQDHKEIARDMLTWLDKMGPYCAYMSDVISAVKGQAVQMIATSSTVKFTVDEVVKRVELLLKHELKKYHCILHISSCIDMSTEIKGEVNNLVQVFDNVVINAMQAYEGQNGTIDLGIVRSGDNVEFTFKDNGKGIPKTIADKLFREMVTTKGKNGTGLGLYMSYSTIKGRFGGNMSFTTKEGCGTTFFISIPCITYSNKEAG